MELDERWFTRMANEIQTKKTVAMHYKEVVENRKESIFDLNDRIYKLKAYLETLSPETMKIKYTYSQSELARLSDELVIIKDLLKTDELLCESFKNDNRPYYEYGSYMYFMKDFKECNSGGDKLYIELTSSILLSGFSDSQKVKYMMNLQEAYQARKKELAEQKEEVKELEETTTESEPEEHIIFISSYIRDGIKNNVKTSLELARCGTMCSFDYFGVLRKQYDFLRDNFGEDKEIEAMLNELSELNFALFQTSPLIVYGVDSEDLYED